MVASSMARYALLHRKSLISAIPIPRFHQAGKAFAFLALEASLKAFSINTT